MKRSNCVYWLCQNTFLCTRSFLQSSLWVTSLEHSLKLTIQCSATKIMNVIISPTTALPYWELGTFLCHPVHYQWLGSDCVNRKTNIVPPHALLIVFLWFFCFFIIFTFSVICFVFLIFDFSSASFFSSSCHEAISLQGNPMLQQQHILHTTRVTMQLTARQFSITVLCKCCLSVFKPRWR